MSQASLAQLGAGARARLALFGALERVSDLRGNAAAGRLKLQVPARPEPALWVYVSTIGELNAIGPLLRQLCERLPQLRLVLITNHAHYESSYRAQYPDAEVCVSLGHGGDARTLGQHYPPTLLVVGEIPCLPSDAPCRFSVAFVAEAKRRGAAAAIVNGWLYGDQPSCRMDHIERSLLMRVYVRAFDAICMQMDDGREVLLRAGAEPDRVHVTGNLKFDAISRSDWSLSQAKSAGLLGALVRSGRPIVVAGCVTNTDEQRLVVDAFVQLRATQPRVLLVVAPRHPEVRERVNTLVAMLRESGLAVALRSQLDGDTCPAEHCLVLDTMGELRDFYAASTVAHVGVDHNVLEPLGFGKPVTVSEGWNTRYPSYPVYRLLMAAGALRSSPNAEQLARVWQSVIESPAPVGLVDVKPSPAVLAAAGAVHKHMDVLSPLLVERPL